jgi:hypothetical protein
MLAALVEHLQRHLTFLATWGRTFPPAAVKNLPCLLRQSWLIDDGSIS